MRASEKRPLQDHSDPGRRGHGTEEQDDNSLPVAGEHSR